MRLVSLLAPDSVVKRELRDAYGSLVTSPLLASWEGNPALAPGRRTSNPWPARVDIASIEAEDNYCAVRGHVVYVTSADTSSPVERREVTLRVMDDNGWRVSAYDEASAGTTAITTTSAADVVRRYYDAIQAGDYDAAYALWSEGGRPAARHELHLRQGSPAPPRRRRLRANVKSCRVIF